MSYTVYFINHCYNNTGFHQMLLPFNYMDIFPQVLEYL